MTDRMNRRIPASCQEPKLKSDLWHAVFTFPHSLTLLSEQSGVPMATIFRFLRGERDIRIETAGRLCDVLGLQLKKVGN